MSKLLGYAIITGSIAVKLPQLYTIIKNKSSAGLQMSMYVLENIGYTISMSYNIINSYPFSTYGENIFLCIQGNLLVYATAYYQNKINTTFIIGAILYIIFTYILLSGSTSIQLLSTLQSLTIPIFAAAKLPQIYSNYKLQSTGQLSVITCTLNFFGSLARVFTTVQEVNDPLLLIGGLSGVSLNGMLLLQIVIYWNNKYKTKKAQ